MANIFPWVVLFLLAIIALNTYNIETTLDHILQNVKWIDDRINNRR